MGDFLTLLIVMVGFMIWLLHEDIDRALSEWIDRKSHSKRKGRDRDVR